MPPVTFVVHKFQVTGALQYVSEKKILVFKTRYGAKYCQNSVFQGVFIFIFNETKLLPAVQCSHSTHYILMNLTIR